MLGVEGLLGVCGWCQVRSGEVVLGRKGEGLREVFFRKGRRGRQFSDGKRRFSSWGFWV